jgi:hypothetical protein
MFEESKNNVGVVFSSSLLAQNNVCSENHCIFSLASPLARNNLQ